MRKYGFEIYLQDCSMTTCVYYDNESCVKHMKKNLKLLESMALLYDIIGAECSFMKNQLRRKQAKIPQVMRNMYLIQKNSTDDDNDHDLVYFSIG